MKGEGRMKAAKIGIRAEKGRNYGGRYLLTVPEMWESDSSYVSRQDCRHSESRSNISISFGPFARTEARSKVAELSKTGAVHKIGSIAKG